MGRDTAIQWCDSTVNPVMGCDGCELGNRTGRPGSRSCYALALHERYKGTNSGFARDFFEPETFPGRMDEAASWSDLHGTDRPDKPWLSGLRRMIFVSDMGDALSASVPFAFLDDEVIQGVRTEQGLRHRWLWLTKRPGQMVHFAEYLDKRGATWPENLWPMTSITGAGTEARVRSLLEWFEGDLPPIGLSIEPLRSEPDWSKVFPCHGCFDWAIFGGESGADAAPCNLDWIRRGIDAARRVGAAVFVKQLGARATDARNGVAGRSLAVPHDARGLISLRLADSHGGDWSEWPEDLRIREVPR